MPYGSPGRLLRVMKTCAALLVTLFMVAAIQAAPRAARDFEAVMALRPDVERGRGIFAACVQCHGPQGGGDPSGSTPRIAGQHYPVLVRQLVDFRRGRRWDFRMEGVTSSHTVVLERQDLADVARFVSDLSPEGTRGSGDGLFLERGREIYVGQCASCHGVSAAGETSRGIPRLAGQHAGYLTRQIYDAVDGRRPQLTRSHRERFEKLVFDEVRGLADYLSRIGDPGTR
jgi:cytochrome c553